MISKYADHLDWICIVSLTSQPSPALWRNHFALLVNILQSPTVSPLPTKPNINVLSWLMPLVTGPLPSSSLPQGHLSLSSYFTTQPHECMSLSEHSIVCEGSILLSWAHFPHWKPPTYSLKLHSRAASTLKLPACTLWLWAFFSKVPFTPCVSGYFTL